MTNYDPHRSTSLVLTEARTVLQRARSALRRIDDEGIALAGYEGHQGNDLELIREALEHVVLALGPWERHTKKEPHRSTTHQD